MQNNFRRLASFSIALISVAISLSSCGMQNPGGKPDRTQLAVKGSFREYASRVAGRYANGLYVGKKKVGYQVFNSQIVSKHGQDYFEYVEEMELATEKRARMMSSKTTTRSLFRLTDGRLESCEQTVNDEGAKYVFALTAKKNGRYLLTTKGQNGVASREIADAGTSMSDYKREFDWLQSGPKKGDHLEYTLGEFEDGEWKQNSVKDVYVGKRSVVIQGVPTDVHSMSVNEDGMLGDCETDSLARLLRCKFGIFSLRMEDESLARNLKGAGVDILAISHIPVKKKMGDTRNLTKLVLRVQGLEVPLPSSFRQKLIGSDTKTKSLTYLIEKDSMSAGRSDILRVADKAKFLRSTFGIQSDSPVIKRLALRVVRDEKDPIQKAALIQSFVYTFLQFSGDSNSSTALEVLSKRKGDCTEHALLFVSLARAAGLPCRTLSGLIYSDTPSPAFYWHAWNEFHDGKQWISVDPTWYEVLVDAGHVTAEQEEGANSHFAAVGTVKFDVVSFESEKKGKLTKWNCLNTAASP